MSDAARATEVAVPRATPAASAEEASLASRVPMSGRDPNEAHRAATPLELLFDLSFVVAVAQAANALHHALADGRVAYGLGMYFIVFFGVWWPWVNSTWFASAYDTDDVSYRLLTFVQIAGVLIVAAGVPRAFENFDFTVIVTGYVVMRTALVAMWLRAAREDPVGRRVALRFAVAIGLIQLLWVARLAIGPPLGVFLILGFGVVEMLIPWWAERSGRHTPWHPGHIAERYGLFTIIVLGECVLAATTAIQIALDASGVTLALIAISLGGLSMVFAMWWAYFKVPAMIGRLTELRWALAWSYGHLIIFGAVAALGAGLQVAVDAVTDPEHVPALTAALSVAVPVAIYLVAIGILHRRGPAVARGRVARVDRCPRPGSSVRCQRRGGSHRRPRDRRAHRGRRGVVCPGAFACRSPISSTGARGLTKYPHHEP